jgi:hypothetical protein
VLADWGVKSIKGDKNAGCVAKVAEMITHYRPDVIVLEDVTRKPFHRSGRIRLLGKRIISLAKRSGVAVMLFSRTQVRQAFYGDGQGTKQVIAEILAKKYSEELGPRLPPKLRPWMRSLPNGLFDAVALSLAIGRRRIRNRNVSGA